MSQDVQEGSRQQSSGGVWSSQGARRCEEQALVMANLAGHGREFRLLAFGELWERSLWLPWKAVVPGEVAGAVVRARMASPLHWKHGCQDLIQMELEKEPHMWGLEQLDKWR